MPKLKCKKCGNEFWGWGLMYQFRAGKSKLCPDCGGNLMEIPDDPMKGDALRGFPENEAA